MKHIIDPDTFERKEQIAFFKQFINPSMSYTSEVECTGAKERAKAHGVSFFLYYAHAMLKAVNEIKEFTYRISESGELCWYDTIAVLAIIRTGENGAYNTLRFEYDPDLISFARKAQHQIDTHTSSTNPYGEEQESQKNNELDVMMISAMPTLSFTSFCFAQRSNMESFPNTLVGKVISREGNEYIPIALNVSHALMDAYHVGKFYNRVTELLKE